MSSKDVSFEAYKAYLKEKEYSKTMIVGVGTVQGYFEKLGGRVCKESVAQFHREIEHLSHRTRWVYLTRLRQYLNWARSPLTKYIVIPKLKKTLPRDIPKQDVMLNTLQKPDISRFEGIRDRVILELLYGTGIRRQELINLTLEDVDVQRLTIRVVQGKYRKDRVLPISSQTGLWLRKYIDEVRDCYGPRCRNVLVGKRGGPLSGNTVLRVVRQYVDTSVHGCRHAFATHMLENGMKETSVQRLLGHSDITTTKVYVHITIQELKRVFESCHRRDSWNI